MMALVTGGSSSGKSAFAEELACRLEPGEKLYLATMRPCDEESGRRVARHRQMRRQKNFVTLERYLDLHLLEAPAQRTVLLECVSNLTANELFRPGGTTEHTINFIVNGIDKLYHNIENIVIVTNEVFSDGVRYDPATQRYLETLSQINLQLARRADLVAEVVCGIPLARKGAL